VFENAVVSSISTPSSSTISTASTATSNPTVTNSVRAQGMTPSNCFQKLSNKALQLSMARWIIYENKPLNLIYSDLFKAMFAGSMGRSFVPMARDTFLQYLDCEFNIFVQAVKKCC
jgi:hypothetical protein